MKSDLICWKIMNLVFVAMLCLSLCGGSVAAAGGKGTIMGKGRTQAAKRPEERKAEKNQRKGLCKNHPEKCKGLKDNYPNKKK